MSSDFSNHLSTKRVTDKMKILDSGSSFNKIDNFFSDCFSNLFKGTLKSFLSLTTICDTHDFHLWDDTSTIVDVLGILTPINADDVMISSVEVSTANSENTQIELPTFQPSVNVNNSFLLEVKGMVSSNVTKIFQRKEDGRIDVRTKEIKE